MNLKLKNLSNILTLRGSQLEQEYYRNKYHLNVEELSLKQVWRIVVYLLLGKNNVYLINKQDKIIYRRLNLDMGNYVSIINLNKVKDIYKMKNKKYFSHTGYASSKSWKNIKGIKQNVKNSTSEDVQTLLTMFQRCIRGMLPKNSFNKKRLRRINIIS